MPENLDAPELYEPPIYLPKRIRKCPLCGDRSGVQYLVFGMQAGQPPPWEEDRVWFAGCLIMEVDGQPNPQWHCPACNIFYSARGEIVDFLAEVA